MSRANRRDGRNAPQSPAAARSWRRHLWWLAVPGGLVLLVALLAGLSHLAPVNFLRPLAAAQLGDALNRPVTVSGDLWLHVGPQVRIVADGVTVHNPPGTDFPRETFLSAGRAEVDLGLWSVLTGSPRIARAAVAGGELLFQVRADGVNNWNLSETTDDKTGRSIGLPPELRVSDGRVALIDVPAGQESAIEDLQIAFTPRFVGPDGKHPEGEVPEVFTGWNLDATGRIRDDEVVLTGSRSVEDPAGVYDLQLDLKSDYLSGGLEGRVYEGPLPGFDGRLDATAPSVGRLAQWLGIPLDPARPDPGSLALALRMTADGERTVVEQLSLQGGQMAGEAQAEFRRAAPGLRVSGAAHFPHLNLDAYLPPPELAPELPTPIANLAVLQALRRIASLPDTPVPLDWLDSTAAGYSLRIGNLTLRDIGLKQSEACFAVADAVASLTLLEDDRQPQEAAETEAAEKTQTAADKPVPGASGTAAGEQEAAAVSGPAAEAADACSRIEATTADAEPPPARTARLRLSLERGGETKEGLVAKPQADVALDAAANALPVGTLHEILSDDRAAGKAKGSEGAAAPESFLTAEAGLRTGGATWLRLAAGIHGRLRAELRGDPGTEGEAPIALRAEAETPTTPLTASFALRRGGHSLAVELNASPLRQVLLEDRFSLKAELKGDLATGKIDGEVLSQPAPGFKGSIAFRSEHPGPLLTFVTGDPAYDGYKPGAVTLDAVLQEQGQTIHIEKAELKAGAAELQLSGVLERQKVLQADLTLVGRHVDLARLLPPAGDMGEGAADLAEEAPAGKQAGGADAVAAASGPAIAGLFPRGAAIALDAKLTDVTAEGIAFSTLHLQGRAAPEQIRLQADGSPAGGGEASLALSLDRSGQQAQAQAKLDIASKDLGRMLAGTEAAKGTAGSGRLTAQFAGSGATLPGLARALTGQARLDISGLRGPELHPVDRLTAALQAGAGETRLTASARFPAPQVEAGDAVRLVAEQEGRAAATNHPVEAALTCKAQLWHCLAAGTAPVDLTLTSGPSKLGFTGEAQLHRDPGRLQGRLTLEGESLSDWDGLVNDAWPFFGPYKLDSRAVLTLRQQAFRNLQLEVGSSDLAGQVLVRWRDGRPVLDADLRSQRLVTDDFGAAKAQDPGLARAVRIPTGWLEWVRGQAKLAVAELELSDGWSLTEVAAELQGDGRRLQVEQFRGAAMQGSIGMTGSLAPGPEGAASVALRGGWRNGSLAAVAARLGSPDIASGRMDALLDAESHGTTLDQLVTRPSGEFFVRIDNGHIADSALGILSVTLADLFSPLFGSSSATDLNCFQSSGTARSGAVTVPNLYLDTDLFDMSGKGGLNLPRESVDMDFRIFGNRVSVASLAPAFSVTGPLEDPGISLNPVETALDVAPSLLGSLVGEVANLFGKVTGVEAKKSFTDCAGGQPGEAKSN